MHGKFLTGAACALAMGLTTPALADDRSPNADERAALEQVLRSNGFESWEEIELDDGRWEVDDARMADGREYDLHIDPQSMQIISRDSD